MLAASLWGRLFSRLHHQALCVIRALRLDVKRWALRMPRISKTVMLNLRIDPELKASAQRAAEADRRSLTAYIEKLIEDDLRAREPAPRRPKAKSACPTTTSKKSSPFFRPPWPRCGPTLPQSKPSSRSSTPGSTC